LPKSFESFSVAPGLSCGPNALDGTRIGLRIKRTPEELMCCCCCWVSSMSQL